MKTPKGKIKSARGSHRRRSREKNTECTLTAKQWDKIIKMQNNKCYECGKEFTEGIISTKDHIIPVTMGGGLTFGNVRALCKSCNSSKNNRVDYMQWIDKLTMEI